MLISDLFSETLHSVSSNKARTGLTVLGIVIGISSVIAMVSIGQGAQAQIEGKISAMGSNLLMVSPGSQKSFGSMVRQQQGSASTLTTEDAEAISESISNIKAVAPQTSSRQQITIKGSNTNASILGTTADYMVARNIQLESGAFITDKNVKSMSKVAVLGYTVKEDLFADEDAVGEKIRIGTLSFTVVGVTTYKGDNTDRQVYAPLTTVQQYLAGGKSLSEIDISVEDEAYMDAVESQVQSLLLSRHGITDSASADFSISSLEDIADTISSTTETFTLLLGSIAAISLIVGGIGIMNMMLTTVSERTREIGLRKALGARAGDISLQFLAESALITLLGGVIGIVLGWLIAFGVEKFTSTTTSVTIQSVMLAFFVSAAIGLVFGYYPARQAARLNPIDALRYE